MSLLSLKLTRANGDLPISLEKAKLFLKVDGAHEDALIIDLIRSITCQFERYTSTALLHQGWCAKYLSEHRTEFVLPITPVVRVEKIVLSSRYAKEQVWSGPYIFLGDVVIMHYLPVSEQISIYFDSGIASNKNEIPADITGKMLRHLAFLYENRDGQNEYSMEIYYEYKRLKV